MSHVAFPLRIDPTGRTARVGEDEHLRQLIEQVLFTSPGERALLPELGTELAAMVFEPLGGESATVASTLVQSSLQRWLGDRIRVLAVDVAESGESGVLVTVRWMSLNNGQVQQATFVGEAGWTR